eukprot:1157312-Pelagomonas_calceolata.AAC.15
MLHHPQWLLLGALCILLIARSPSLGLKGGERKAQSLREFNDSPSKENALVMCHTAMFYHISTIAETKFDL